MRSASLGEPGVHLVFGRDVHLAEDAAQFLGQRFAHLRIQVEQRDLDALRAGDLSDLSLPNRLTWVNVRCGELEIRSS